MNTPSILGFFFKDPRVIHLMKSSPLLRRWKFSTIWLSILSEVIMVLNSKIILLINSFRISQNFSIVGTPQQKGVVERRNLTIIEAARSMLSEANLATQFWAEAVNIAYFTHNRSPKSSPLLRRWKFSTIWLSILSEVIMVLNSKIVLLMNSFRISQNFSTVGTPQQNGVAERRNWTIIKAARSMLSEANLATQFWTEAVYTTYFTQNRSLLIPWKVRSQNWWWYISWIFFNLQSILCVQQMKTSHWRNDSCNLWWITISELKFLLGNEELNQWANSYFEVPDATPLFWKNGRLLLI